MYLTFRDFSCIYLDKGSRTWSVPRSFYDVPDLIEEAKKGTRRLLIMVRRNYLPTYLDVMII